MLLYVPGPPSAIRRQAVNEVPSARNRRPYHDPRLYRGGGGPDGVGRGLGGRVLSGADADHLVVLALLGVDEGGQHPPVGSPPPAAGLTPCPPQPIFSPRIVQVDISGGASAPDGQSWTQPSE
jgi:hypothetical protein